MALRWRPPPRLPTRLVTRVGLVWAICTVLVVVAGGVFDRVLWGLLWAPPLPITVAAVTRTTSPAVRAAVLAAAVAAGVLTAVWFATGATDEIASGLLDGPRRLITTEWPSPVEPAIVATLALLLAGISAVAATLAVDDRYHLLPLAPMLAGLIGLLALSSPRPLEPWQLAVAGGLTVAFALTGSGVASTPRRRSPVGDRTTPITALALIVIAVLASNAVAWADRSTPRTTEPAELSAVLLDPIEAMVALRRAQPPIELLQIADRSSADESTLPDRWRIAALDRYDGQRWVPQLTLRPIGGTLDAGDRVRAGATAVLRYRVEFRTDDLDTIPFPGHPLSVDTSVETDTDRVVVRLPDRPVPGDSVLAESARAPAADDVRRATIATRPVDDIAATFATRADSLAGDGTVEERLRRIEQTMRTDWQRDPSAPGGGLQLALLERFAGETRRGTAEQFVTAFVLLVRSLGFDARVATGFVIPPDQLGGTVTIDSTHAAVWPEVELEGVGWLAFDPVPPTPDTERDDPPTPPDAQSPAAAQPPIAPPAEPGDDSEDVVTDDPAAGDGWRSWRTWSVRVGAGVGVGLLPFLVCVGAVVLVKWRRRRRRLRVDDPIALVRGVWANTTDALVDAGLSIAPTWTDQRIAEQAAALAPGAPHEVRRLASMSTAVTFGPSAAGGLGDAGRLADDAVHTSHAVVDAIRSPLSRRQRIRWWLSVRSLRRSTRSPVVP